MTEPQDEPFTQPDETRAPAPYAGTYGQPPGVQPHDPAYGQYDPRWGYGPPRNPQQGMLSSQETTMAMLAYVLGLLTGFLGPLILYFVKRRESEFVRYHAAQALNFALTQMIAVFAVLVPVAIAAIAFKQPALLVIFVPVYLYEMISPYVWMILGAIRSSKGEMFRIPRWTCWPMVH
ncbi:MAG TPA: DUF4870 domain-containing protein [Streptosporangiaceae bacterium]|nr:DUF4870 domain-containing protein [Streptosporangiaceae bacterium]